jgi:hypothetical protein
MAKLSFPVVCSDINEFCNRQKEIFVRADDEKQKKTGRKRKLSSEVLKTTEEEISNHDLSLSSKASKDIHSIIIKNWKALDLDKYLQGTISQRTLERATGILFSPHHIFVLFFILFILLFHSLFLAVVAPEPNDKPGNQPSIRVQSINDIYSIITHCVLSYWIQDHTFDLESSTTQASNRIPSEFYYCFKFKEISSLPSAWRQGPRKIDGKINGEVFFLTKKSSSSSLLNYIQKFTIIEDRLNPLKRFNVSAINKGTLLNNVGRLGTSVFT